jgi:hypothetical protein
LSTPLPFEDERESLDKPVELGLDVLERRVALGAIGVEGVEVGTRDEMEEVDIGVGVEEEELEVVVTVETTTAGAELDPDMEEAGGGRVEVRVVTIASPGEEELLSAAEFG